MLGTQGFRQTQHTSLHSMNKNPSLCLIAVNAQFVLRTVNLLYCRVVVAFRTRDTSVQTCRQHCCVRVCCWL